jgi:hypothetical protein
VSRKSEVDLVGVAAADIKMVVVEERVKLSDPGMAGCYN